MPLATTAHFDLHAAARGRQPVFLLELPAMNRYLASRPVTLNGRSYVPLLAPGGVSGLTRELLDDDTPRVSSVTVSIVNPALFSSLVDSYTLDNQVARIRLGFLDGGDADYTTLFQGVIDSFPTTWRRFQLSILDGTFQRHVSLPEILPAFFGATTNPADVMKLILQTYCPLLTVDTASFAAFATARAGWAFTSTVAAQTLSRDLFVRMARQAQGRYIEAPDGTVRLVPIEKSATSVLTVTPSELAPGSVEIGRSAANQLYTDIYVHYARNPALGAWDSQAAYTAETSATPVSTTHPTEPLHVLCKRGQTAFNGQRTRLDYLADWITDATTANRLLRFLVIWHTQRRYVIQLQTWLNAAKLDLADAITFPAYTLLPSRMRGRPLEVIGRRDTGQHIALTLQEMGHPQWQYHVEHWEVSQASGTQRWYEPWDDSNAMIDETWTPTTLTPTVLLSETWEPTALASTLELAETWEPSALTATLEQAESWEVY